MRREIPDLASGYLTGNEMRILVTGANGALGNAIVASLLEAGHRVLGVSRKPAIVEAKFAGRFENVIAPDYGKADWHSLLSGIEMVVHAAGNAGNPVNANSGIDDKAREAEISITDQLAAATAKMPRVKLFVAIGSAKAISEYGIISDHSRPRPTSAYGKCKFACEEAIAANLGKGGCPWLVLRLMPVYGTQHSFMRFLEDRIAKGGFIPVVKREIYRSILHLGNLCDAIVHLAGMVLANPPGSPNNTAIASGAYLLADEEPVTVRAICEIIAMRSGRKARFATLPDWVAGAIASTPLFREGGRIKRLANGLSRDYASEGMKFGKAFAWEAPFDIETPVHFERKQFQPKEPNTKK
jgi:nucleoside-diphosphate-sugar epimerase